MKTIIKVKNFEGHWLTCASCGKQIKHAFHLECDNTFFGSECIKAVAGFSTKKAKSEIAIANSRMNRLESLMTLCSEQFNEMVKEFGSDTEKMILNGQL